MNTPLTDAEREAQARQRFFLLAILRFGGVALAMFGIAMMVGKIPVLDGAPGRYAGMVITLFGAFDVIVLPVLLARRWNRGRTRS